MVWCKHVLDVTPVCNAISLLHWWMSLITTTTLGRNLCIIDCDESASHSKVGSPGRRCNLEVLIEQGLLRGSATALQEADIGALFMPHGLGHLLGIDTHDVGGYGNGLPPRSTTPGLKSLRLGRCSSCTSYTASLMICCCCCCCCRREVTERVIWILLMAS